MGGVGEQEARVWTMAADRQGGGREAASGETARGYKHGTGYKMCYTVTPFERS